MPRASRPRASRSTLRDSSSQLIRRQPQRASRSRGCGLYKNRQFGAPDPLSLITLLNNRPEMTGQQEDLAHASARQLMHQQVKEGPAGRDFDHRLRHIPC